MKQETIEDPKRKYESVLNHGNRPVKYCSKEKCEIKKMEDRIVIRKGQNIPQALLEQTKEYMNGLAQRRNH